MDVMGLLGQALGFAFREASADNDAVRDRRKRLEMAAIDGDSAYAKRLYHADRHGDGLESD